MGYFLGSIPFGYIVGKMRGIDIREHGSGNIGATNVFRTMGRKWGVLVFVLDALKGVLAVRLAMIFGEGWAVGGPELFGILAGLACFLGHCFPVWLKFKGGKGIAPAAGILIGLIWPAVLICTGVFLLVFLTSRYVSLGSIVTAVALPIATYFLQGGFTLTFWFTLLISALAIWRHRGNIARLWAGTEHRFSFK